MATVGENLQLYQAGYNPSGQTIISYQQTQKIPAGFQGVLESAQIAPATSVTTLPAYSSLYGDFEQVQLEDIPKDSSGGNKLLMWGGIALAAFVLYKILK